MGKFVSERTCMKERLPCRMICCRMIAISLEWAVISLVIATLSSFSVVERSRRSSSFEIFSFNAQISFVSSSAMFTIASIWYPIDSRENTKERKARQKSQPNVVRLEKLPNRKELRLLLRFSTRIKTTFTSYINSLKQSSHNLRDHSRRERSYFANKFTKQIRYYKPQYNHKTYTKHLTITFDIPPHNTEQSYKGTKYDTTYY